MNLGEVASLSLEVTQLLDEANQLPKASLQRQQLIQQALELAVEQHFQQQQQPQPPEQQVEKGPLAKADSSCPRTHSYASPGDRFSSVLALFLSVGGYCLELLAEGCALWLPTKDVLVSAVTGGILAAGLEAAGQASRKQEKSQGWDWKGVASRAQTGVLVGVVCRGVWSAVRKQDN
jgi:hypothetical protein